MPQIVEELDEEGIRYLYKRRCKEDCLVVPYNLEILLFWGASMNIQRVSKHGFEMYLAKYISKPEPSFQVNLSENASDPEKYLRTRVVGSCEAIDVQLGFNQYHISRMVEFLPTELNPKQKFLKIKPLLHFYLLILRMCTKSPNFKLIWREIINYKILHIRCIFNGGAKQMVVSSAKMKIV